MRLLLDTHAVLWWHDDDTRLSVPARRAISRADLVLVSAASAWEVAIEIGLGKLQLPIPFEEVVTRNGFAELSVTVRHAAEVADVRLKHRNPFDRMLVAQALVEGATFVSRDKSARRLRCAGAVVASHGSANLWELSGHHVASAARQRRVLVGVDGDRPCDWRWARAAGPARAAAAHRQRPARLS